MGIKKSMKTKDSIHELFAAAVELTKRQALEANIKLMDHDYEEGARVINEDSEEVVPGFVVTKRVMWLPNEWWYEVQINDGDVRKFGLYVEMLEYLRDVADILSRKIDPFYQADA